jgi:hypothetical protein
MTTVSTSHYLTTTDWNIRMFLEYFDYLPNKSRGNTSLRIFHIISSLYICTKGIQKVSSVRKYCSCSAAVTILPMRAEFLYPLASDRHNFETIRS